jgi:sec-independent protein translocase protein TatA
VFRTLFEGPVGLILILIILAVFFGPKLPAAAKGIAQSIKVFKKELNNDDKKSTDKEAADAKSEDKKSGDQ